MLSSTVLRNRRDFLLASSAASIATLLPRSMQAATQNAHTPEDHDPVPEIPSKDTTLKFNPDGSRRAFAGNTVICHLPQQCHARDAIASLAGALRTSPFVNKLGLLPNDSYHMTVFAGANDQARTANGWPADVPMDAPIAECNRIVGARMAEFHLHCELPLRVSVSLQRTLEYGRACTLRMVPADGAENTRLRTLRDRLAEVYRFRAKDHATYAFHITLAYQMTRFTAEEQTQYRTMLEEHLPRIIAASPVIELGIPEFCTFDDMYRFEIVTLLKS